MREPNGTETLPHDTSPMTDESNHTDSPADAESHDRQMEATESLFDPESLRHRADVEFDEETKVLEREEFEAVRDELETWDSHVAVGVTNHEGAVLLMNDGSHGWNLTAVPVEPGEDWAAAARRGAEALTGVAVEIDGPERVRRIDYYLEASEASLASDASSGAEPGGPGDEADRGESQDEDEWLTTVYTVVFRASPVEGEPIADQPGLDGEDVQDVGWFDEVPEVADSSEEDTADDVRLFVD